MKRIALWLGLIAMVSTAAEHCRADAAAETPDQMIRALGVLQDEVIKGNKSAIGQQETLLERLAQVISSATDDTWRDERNLKALTHYLVNSGPPHAVRRMLGRKVALGSLEKIILALLAFSERRGDAKAKLAELDASSFHSSIGAPLALAQGIEFQGEPAKAMPYLKMAQLLAPGTLIDEAAVRREIALLLAEKKDAEAMVLAGRYLWRFGSSAYASDVVEYLASSVLPAMAIKDSGMRELKAFLEEVPPDVRRQKLLDIARTGLLTGKLDQVAFASGSAMDGSSGVSSDQSRARLYMSVARALSKQAEAAEEDLSKVDRALLDDVDAGILDAARTVVDRVRQPTADSDKSFDPASDSPPVVLAAQKVLSRADDILMKVTP